MLVKCNVGEMSCWRIVSWWNVILVKCQLANCKLAICFVEEMSCWQIVNWRIVWASFWAFGASRGIRSTKSWYLFSVKRHFRSSIVWGPPDSWILPSSWRKLLRPNLRWFGVIISQPRSFGAKEIPPAIGRLSTWSLIFANIVSHPMTVWHRDHVSEKVCNMSHSILIFASTRPCCSWAFGVETMTVKAALDGPQSSIEWSEKLVSCSFSSCVPESTNKCTGALYLD
jgi:hypothetical protein